jgi:hypothetical protein
MHRALAPVQRRLQRHPIIRADTLVSATRAWIALPTFGRVRCSIDTSNRRRPIFYDVRVVAGRYRGLGWAPGAYEDALAVVLITASVQGHDMPVVAGRPWCDVHCRAHALGKQLLGRRPPR